MTMKHSFLKGLACLGLTVSIGAFVPGSAIASGGGTDHIEAQHWSFGGVRGHFERNQLQRGFQVYKEVCSTCHGVKRLSFRNLVEKGGPEFPEEGAKALAATYKIVDGPNDQGKMFKRPGRLSDRIPNPFSNDAEARSANNGALPPDLSLIALARKVETEHSFWQVPFFMAKDIVMNYQEGGADYVHALLSGYRDEPPAYKEDHGHLIRVSAEEAKANPKLPRCASITSEKGSPDVCNKLADGMQYNAYFPGNQIAMPPPLRDGAVKYTDGTPGTLDNYARDVTAFLAWAADPKLEERKRLGLMTMLYLAVTAVLLGFAKRRVWSGIPH
jgi:ubiquinol-cytochrome c reductase cytochrome c1 subunit